MKKITHLGMALLLFLSCNQSPERYTQNSPEIDTVKKLIANYNAKNFDTSLYADSSQTRYNTKDNLMSPSETMEYHKQNDANYSQRSFLDEDQEFEMVITDDGETWVNCWLDWKGTVGASGKEILIPIHLTYRFVDGKIVREVGMWDPTEVVMELQSIEAMNNLSPEENKGIVNAMYQSFAKGDIPAVLEKLDARVVWNEAEGNPYADHNPYVGPDAVLNGVFARLGNDHEYFKLAKIKLHDVDDDKVLATLRYNAKRKDNGAMVDAQAAHLWTIKNGKAVAFQQYADTKQLHETTNK
ncbi:nuclear transport factor 2 family protein [Allomuricauda sp. d1]|uniref:nuclear transport factor 2 family protein n=1 Tax=Allomuricauda sp. d1 TaxID=3136725 RepID=UPI0031D49857